MEKVKANRYRTCRLKIFPYKINNMCLRQKWCEDPGLKKDKNWKIHEDIKCINAVQLTKIDFLLNLHARVEILCGLSTQFFKQPTKL